MGTSDVHVARARVVNKLEELQIPYAIRGGSGLSAPDRLQGFADVFSLIRVNELGENLADDLHAYVQPKYPAR